MITKVPGAGHVSTILSALGGAAAPAAGVAGGIGLAGMLAKMRVDSAEELAPYSPAVSRAMSEAEVKEIQRKIELARKYGQQDAAVIEQYNNAWRTYYGMTGEAMRNPASLVQAVIPVFGELQKIRLLMAGWNEWFRDAKSENPMARFMEGFENLDLPAEFTGGVSVHENHEYEPVIGL